MVKLNIGVASNTQKTASFQNMQKLAKKSTN